jgi:hypothetical protein
MQINLNDSHFHEQMTLMLIYEMENKIAMPLNLRTIRQLFYFKISDDSLQEKVWHSEIHLMIEHCSCHNPSCELLVNLESSDSCDNEQVPSFLCHKK